MAALRTNRTNSGDSGIFIKPDASSFLIDFFKIWNYSKIIMAVDEKHAVCPSTGEIENALKGVGIRPTAQRLAICRYALCEADHPTADDVMSWATANFPKVSLATVYNTLNILVEAGLLREFKFPHSGKVVYDRNVSQHFHLLDEDSGELIDLDPADVDVDMRLRLKRRYAVRDVDVLFYGTRKG